MIFNEWIRLTISTVQCLLFLYTCNWKLFLKPRLKSQIRTADARRNALEQERHRGHCHFSTWMKVIITCYLFSLADLQGWQKRMLQLSCNCIAYTVEYIQQENNKHWQWLSTAEKFKVSPLLTTTGKVERTLGGPGSIAGRVSFPGWGFFRCLSSTVIQM